MIRPSEINALAHTANWKCDECGNDAGEKNVNTDPNITYIDEGGSHVGIRVGCWACSIVSCFPITGGGPLCDQLASAKTA